ANALPARLTPSGPGNISGNSVRTVARQIVDLAVMAFHRASRPGRQTAIGHASKKWKRVFCKAIRLQLLAQARESGPRIDAAASIACFRSPSGKLLTPCYP